MIIKLLKTLALLFLVSTVGIPAYSTEKKAANAAVTTGTSVPFELIDNRIFVNVFLNGQGPFKFIFDTGGGNSLSPETAQKLGLKTIAAGEATGAGEDSVPMQSSKMAKLQVGDLVFSDQDFLVIDYSPIKRAFQMKSFDGVFGFEILQRFVTYIDYQKKILSFVPNTLPVKTNGYESVSFEIIGDKPVIQARINGLSAKVLIDTGDRSALTVFKNLYVKKEMENIFSASPIQTTGYGIGGPIPARLGQVKLLGLTENLRLTDVIARAPTTKGGFNSEKNVNASIGTEVLKQFDVIFDYKNKLAYFKANKGFGQKTIFTKVPNP